MDKDHPESTGSTTSSTLGDQAIDATIVLNPEQFPDLCNAQHLAVDIGGTLAKLAYFTPARRPRSSSFHLDKLAPEGDAHLSDGGRLHMVKCPTKELGRLLEFISKTLLSRGSQVELRSLKATGGGAHKFVDELSEKLHLEVKKLDEMTCLIAGCNFVLRRLHTAAFSYWHERPVQKEYYDATTSPFPYLLVNIGSGVSMVKVDGPCSFERVGGTSLGGGTFWGLASLLTQAKGFDEALELSTRGNHRNVDMLVGDIYGGAYNKIGLTSDTIASSFGKAMRFPESDNTDGAQLSDADKAKSLLHMISNNIGQIAYLTARLHNISRVFFAGFFIRGHPHTMRTISYAIRFWSQSSMEALFLRHEGYLGAIGAFLDGNQDGSVAATELSWCDEITLVADDTIVHPVSTAQPTAHSSLACVPSDNSYSPDTFNVYSDFPAWLSLLRRSAARSAERLRAVYATTTASSSNDDNYDNDDSSVPSRSSSPPLPPADHTAPQRIRRFLNSFNAYLDALPSTPPTSTPTHDDDNNGAPSRCVTFRSLIDARLSLIRSCGFPDPYTADKARDTALALAIAPRWFAELDAAHSDPISQSQIAFEGLLAGNFFDWDAEGAVEFLLAQSPSTDPTTSTSTTTASVTTASVAATNAFSAARTRIRARAHAAHASASMLDWHTRLSSTHSFPAHPLIFADNCGPDFVLGVLGLARCLLGWGSHTVTIAVNSTPTLNDVCIAEADKTMAKVARIDPVIAQALKDKRLFVLENGLGSPCVDLSRVDVTLSEATKDTDLLVLVGMGRALHTNLNSRFLCPSIKVAVIKNEFIAQQMDAQLFDVVCKYDNQLEM